MEALLIERIKALEITVTGNSGIGHEHRIEENKKKLEKKVDVFDCQKQHQELINVLKGKKEGVRFWAKWVLNLAPWVIILLTYLKIF